MQFSVDKDPVFKIGKQAGVIEFCQYLRGKVDALALSQAWESYNTKQHNVEEAV